MRRRLTCCVCGCDAGRWEQHWNRDTGFGICPECVAWLKDRGETDETLRNAYGVAGVNYDPTVVNASGGRSSV